MSKQNHVIDDLAEYSIGALHGRRKARVEAHLRDCADCRKELAALERTGELLSAAPLEGAPAGTWEAVRRRIESRAPAPARPRLGWALAVGTVALLVIVIGLTLMLGPVGDMGSDVVVATEPDDQMLVTIEGRLPTAWAAPLADEVAVGLRFAYLEDDG
jgi:anti-sigma factor RsiW